MANILVVGATGFIGKHLVDELIKRGDTVNVFVRSSQKILPESENAVRISIGDIEKKESIKGVCKDIDFVFHLAAKVHDFSKDGDNEEDHFRVNVEGTKNVLEECGREGIKQFVYFSSVKAIGETSEVPLNELSLPCPQSSYGESKLAAEEIVLEYGKRYSFSTTSLRLPLVYGPGNKGNIFRMISAIDKGYFLMMGKGESKRSMVYVGNVVDAAIAVLGKENANGKVYIVTDGQDYTVQQLYSAITQALGKKAFSFYVPFILAKICAKIGDWLSCILGNHIPFTSGTLSRLTSSFIVSSKQIQTDVGFKPRYNLYNTMSATVQWYRTNRKKV